MKALGAMILGIVWAATANAQTLHLTLHSPPGEVIGGGHDSDVTYFKPTAAIFGVNLNAYNGLPGPDELEFYMMEFPISTHYMTAAFGTNQLGQIMAPGTYLNAERTAFASPGHPGLDVTFEHRGNNQVTGSFTINDVTYHDNAGSWVLDSFDATFSQVTQGGTLAMTGRITYSAVPEAGSLLAIGTGLALLSVRRRRKS